MDENLDLLNGLMAEAMFSAYLDRTVYLMHNCDISGQMEALLQRLEQFDGDYDKMADETAVAVLEILQKLHNQAAAIPARFRSRLRNGSICMWRKMSS